MGKRGSGTITTTVKGYEVEIDYYYSPPCKGARDSFNGVPGRGIQLEPDEPADVEIEAWRLVNEEDKAEIEAEEVEITEDDIIEAFWNYDEDPDPDYGQE